jgi:hypothetical protein
MLTSWSEQVTRVVPVKRGVVFVCFIAWSIALSDQAEYSFSTEVGTIAPRSGW